MKNQKSFFKRLGATFLAALMATSLFASVAFAAKEQNVDQDPNSDAFMPLSKFSTPTEIPGVFQVTLMIQPPEITPPPVYVALVLDESGSMSVEDIWDSTTNTWLARDEAVKKASQQFVDTMIASGNQDVHIDIITFTTTWSTHFTRSTTGGFKDLFSNGIVDSSFADLSTGYLSTYQNASGTPMADGLRLAYNAFSTTAIPTNANRYVLLLTDGADSSSPLNTSQYAAALKAPLGQTVTSLGLPAAVVTTGMDVNIWSVVFGTDIAINQNWSSDYLTSGITGANFDLWNPSAYSTVVGSGSRNAEAMMVAHSIDLGDSATYGGAFTNSTAAATAYPLIQTFYKNALGTTSLTNGTNANYYFSMNMKDDIAGLAYGANINTASPPSTDSKPYVPESKGSTPALDIFDNFAKAALGGAKKTTATDILGSNFEMYKMDGEPMLATSTDDPDPTVGMDATYIGDKLSWTFEKLNGGYRYWLRYYVKYTGPESEKDLWHTTNKDAYIEYLDADGKTVIKNFPQPFVVPSSNETKVEANTSVTEEIQTNATGNTTMANPNAATSSNNTGTTGNIQTVAIVPETTSLTTHYSSNKRIETIKDKVTIYQKTKSGKYKAVATVNKGMTFVVLNEEGDYYRVIYQVKGAKKSSIGYIKKTDAKVLANAATTSTKK